MLHQLPPVDVGLDEPGTIGDAQFKINSRITKLGLSQSEIALQVDKRRAWVSSELLKNPRKAIATLLAYEPHKVELLASVLGWPINEMLVELHVFRVIPRLAAENTSIAHLKQIPFFPNLQAFKSSFQDGYKHDPNAFRTIDELFFVPTPLNISMSNLIKLDTTHCYFEPDLLNVFLQDTVILVERVIELSHVTPNDIVVSVFESSMFLRRSKYIHTNTYFVSGDRYRVYQKKPSINYKDLAIVKRIVDIDIMSFQAQKGKYHQSLAYTYNGESE